MITKLLRQNYIQWRFHKSLLIQHAVQKKQYKQLLQIVEERKIETFFQPIISLTDCSIIGLEALNRPQMTNVFQSTEEFYQFLGGTDQIFEFEKLTRQLSIERYVHLKTKVMSPMNDLIFLNVHPHVLNDANYRTGRTLRLIEESGLDPRNIVFEITEKQAVQDYQQFERVLTNYRSQGFKIAIDDVGAGYNSLKTMMYIKPDFIKLDRSFISAIDKQVEQQRLVHLFVQYAEQSKSKVIAEGVERKEELQCLQQLSVDLAQGYYIGRPAQSTEIPSMIPVYSRKYKPTFFLI